MYCKQMPAAHQNLTQPQPSWSGKSWLQALAYKPTNVTIPANAFSPMPLAVAGLLNPRPLPEQFGAPISLNMVPQLMKQVQALLQLRKICARKVPCGGMQARMRTVLTIGGIIMLMQNKHDPWAQQASTASCECAVLVPWPC